MSMNVHLALTAVQQMKCVSTLLEAFDVKTMFSLKVCS